MDSTIYNRAGEICLLILILLAAGCGGTSQQSAFVASPQTVNTVEVSTATVRLQTVLSQQAVPSAVIAFRAFGYDSDGVLLYGPNTVSKASPVDFTGVPVAVTRFTVEFLDDSGVVLISTFPVSLLPNQTLVVDNPELLALSELPTEIFISPPSLTVPKGLSAQVSALGTFRSGSRPLNDSVIWSSSNPSVATVDQGRVEALNQGQVVITASLGTLTAETALEVTAPVPVELVLSPDSPVVGVESSIGLAVRAVLSDGSEQASLSGVAFASSETAVATIEEDGTLTGITAGQTTITASYLDLTATTVATVTTAFIPDLIIGADATFDTDTGELNGTVFEGWNADENRLDVLIFQVDSGATLTLKGSNPFLVHCQDRADLSGTLDGGINGVDIEIDVLGTPSLADPSRGSVVLNGVVRTDRTSAGGRDIRIVCAGSADFGDGARLSANGGTNVYGERGGAISLQSLQSVTLGNNVVVSANGADAVTLSDRDGGSGGSIEVHSGGSLTAGTGLSLTVFGGAGGTDAFSNFSPRPAANGGSILVQSNAEQTVGDGLSVDTSGGRGGGGAGPGGGAGAVAFLSTGTQTFGSLSVRGVGGVGVRSGGPSFGGRGGSGARVEFQAGAGQIYADVEIDIFGGAGGFSDIGNPGRGGAGGSLLIRAAADQSFQTFTLDSSGGAAGGTALELVSSGGNAGEVRLEPAGSQTFSGLLTLKSEGQTGSGGNTVTRPGGDGGDGGQVYLKEGATANAGGTISAKGGDGGFGDARGIGGDGGLIVYPPSGCTTNVSGGTGAPGGAAGTVVN